MFKSHSAVVTPFMQNARVIYCEDSLQAVVVDPGGDSDRIAALINDHNLDLAAIWLTHCHLDHCGGVADLLELFKVPLFAHPDEKFMRQHINETAAFYGVPEGYFKNCPEPDHYLRGGETVNLGDNQFKVLFTPGHSPGHISFHNIEQKVLISGDVLFSGAIGRTDLPGGNYDQLIRTIKQQLMVLPDDTQVWCGHGPDTTIGAERRSNPFLQ